MTDAEKVLEVALRLAFHMGMDSFRDWFDTSIKVLDNQTPRELIRDKKTELLLDLVKSWDGSLIGQ